MAFIGSYLFSELWEFFCLIVKHDVFISERRISLAAFDNASLLVLFEHIIPRTAETSGAALVIISHITLKVFIVQYPWRSKCHVGVRPAKLTHHLTFSIILQLTVV